MKNSNKYRVSVYLGKELHKKLEIEAKALGIPLSTYVKIILDYGKQVQESLEKVVEYCVR